MEAEVIVEQTNSGDASLSPEVQLEQQEALDRYKKSTGTSDDDGNDIPEGFNADGTPIVEEEGSTEWETKYNDLEIKHILATNEHAYQTDLGVFDATSIVEDVIANGKLSEEDFAELIETGLTKEQIDEAVADLLEGRSVDTTQTAFDVNKYHQELASNGNLSDKSYAELEKYGFTKNDVDIYINGQRDIAEAFATSLFSIAGGEQEYTQLIDWASQNMDRETISKYIKAVETNDRTTVKSLVEFVKFKRDGNAGTQEIKPQRLNGNSDSYGGVAPFTSKADWYQATSNRLYGKDAKYTKMVENRYLASRKSGSI